MQKVVMVLNGLLDGLLECFRSWLLDLRAFSQLWLLSQRRLILNRLLRRLLWRLLKSFLVRLLESLLRRKGKLSGFVLNRLSMRKVLCQRGIWVMM